MRRSRPKTGAKAATAALGAVLAALACSSRTSRPPELGNCVPDDSGCTSVSVGGGSTGGGGGEGGAAQGGCTTSSSDSLCDQCAGANCCAPLASCSQATGCQNLRNCEQTCGASASCIDTCQTQFASGTSPLALLVSCLEAKCPVCSQIGVGDPCGGQACNAGLTCQGLWCSKGCARTADCTGIGPNGGNLLGRRNACMAASSGLTCAAGCMTDADCQPFPSTYCLATTSADGLAVQVCTSYPDGGSGGGG
ncbi:MAG TPA: hypothetical protein VKU41_26405 [Polyangiaceae bacterium]|nr:hypothetical protein [Polyangiaceae bacterium]